MDNKQKGWISDFLLGIMGIIILACFVATIIYLFLGGVPTIKLIFNIIINFLKKIYYQIVFFIKHD